MDDERCVLRFGVGNMDFRRVTEMLAGAFWCPGISIGEVEKGAANSALVVGAFLGDLQIGYGRCISDKTRFAYILDVYVDPRYQRRGIGRRMVRGMMAHPDMTDVYQWALVTKDAHGVYRELGFAPTARPGDWMEIRNPRPR